MSRKSKINDLVEYDKNISEDSLLIGLDEAGRGPVAGPVMAAAVYLDFDNKDLLEFLKYLDDSKKFSSNPKLRKKISEEIKQHSVYSIQECSIKEIEKHNILQASLLAMKRAAIDVINQIGDKKAKTGLLCLVDGKISIKNFKYKQKTVVKGDSLSASIAAASILAKVYRDEFMIKLSEEFAQYEWQKNKGYGTKAHLDAIREHGICEWHRKSFLAKVLTPQLKLL